MAKANAKVSTKAKASTREKVWKLEDADEFYTRKKGQDMIALIQHHGATRGDLMKMYRINGALLNECLLRYHKREKKREEIRKLLWHNQNKRTNEAKKAEVEAKKAEVEAKKAEVEAKKAEVEAKKANVMPTLATKKPAKRVFLLDSQLILRHDGRKVWSRLIKALEGEDFEVYSTKELRWMQRNATLAAAVMAGELLVGKLTKAETTVLSLPEYAAYIEAEVITNSDLSKEICQKIGLKVHMVDDFLREKIEYTRRYTLPMTLNRRNRIVGNLEEIQHAIERLYSCEGTMDVYNKSGKKKQSPTGMLLFEKEDVIVLRSENLEVKLEIIAESVKENAIEIEYKDLSEMSKMETKKEALVAMT